MILLKSIALSLLMFVLAIALTLGTMRLGWWNPSYESVRARQAGPPSKFVDVGDVRLHVRDEGSGPVLLMLHSSMTNLREWDAWAERLKPHYRVVRLDWPPYGLSIDPRPSRGAPGVVELLERFVEQERLGRFALVATSSGATIAVLYASQHPERVAALALSTLPLATPPPFEPPRAERFLQWLHEHVVPNYQPRLYYQLSLANLYGTPARLKPEVIDWYDATNNLAGGFARVNTYLAANRKAVWSRGAAKEAGMITAPVLLQWGDSDPVLPAGLGDTAKMEFTHAPVTLIHYPNAGHYLMLEIPEESGRDVEAFLDRVLTPAS